MYRTILPAFDRVYLHGHEVHPDRARLMENKVAACAPHQVTERLTDASAKMLALARDLSGRTVLADKAQVQATLIRGAAVLDKPNVTAKEVVGVYLSIENSFPVLGDIRELSNALMSVRKAMDGQR